MSCVGAVLERSGAQLNPASVQMGSVHRHNECFGAARTPRIVQNLVDPGQCMHLAVSFALASRAGYGTSYTREAILALYEILVNEARIDERWKQFIR